MPKRLVIAFSGKKKTKVSHILNPEGQKSWSTGSKVTAIWLSWWNLSIGEVASASLSLSLSLGEGGGMGVNTYLIPV